MNNKQKLEKVLPPCQKNTATLEEIMLHCSGCFPIAIAEKFATKTPATPGYLGVSYSEDKKELHCCLYSKGTQHFKPKLKLIVRFAIPRRSIGQLRALMKIVESGD